MINDQFLYKSMIQICSSFSNDDNSKCTMINKKIFVFIVSCIIPDLITDCGTNEKLNFQKFILYHLHNNPWHKLKKSYIWEYGWSNEYCIVRWSDLLKNHFFLFFSQFLMRIYFFNCHKIVILKVWIIMLL